MAELMLKENMEKAQTESNLSNTNDDVNIELSKEFLMELQRNAYHGWLDKDVVDHIAKVLEILDLIKIPNVDTDRLRTKEYDYGNPPNTTTDSFFKPYSKTQEKNNVEKEDKQSQTKRKCCNNNLNDDLQPIKRDLAAKKSTKLVKYQSSGILCVIIVMLVRILELKRRNMKKTDSDNQYAVSIKEDTAYLCMHFTKDHGRTRFYTPYPEKTNTPYSRYRM
ncbi:hypothetical protein Tco_1207505 [Tanacetum coccineum]